jgi:hypothetical protein
MRYWNMARQRYCCGLARCWRNLRLSADRAENAARKRALFGALIEESGSHMTRRWGKGDSNPRSPSTVSSVHSGVCDARSSIECVERSAADGCTVRGGQVRSGLSAGGRRIRTLGPP